MKPHLRRFDGYWLCVGASIIGYGVTAQGAYKQWQAVACKVGSRDDVFAGLSKTLAQWEPEGMAQ